MLFLGDCHGSRNEHTLIDFTASSERAVLLIPPKNHCGNMLPLSGCIETVQLINYQIEIHPLSNKFKNIIS